MNLDKYRKAFREKIIPRYYSAKWHIFIFGVFQLTATLWSARQVEWSLLSILWIGLSLLWATSALYLVHRFFLHRKIWGLGWAHRMHRWHHTFYQKEKMEYDQLNDVYMLLMPPWLQVVYFVVYLPVLTLLLSYVLPLTFIQHFIFSLTIWYGIYELIHWTEHLPKTHPLMRLSFLIWMRQHHLVHHDPQWMDQKNFGIVEPSQDYLWGSKA